MIDYLVIGHICADLQSDGTTRLGGTALYAALTAHNLGLRAAIVTACTPDFDLSALPATIPILRQPSLQTTIFENRYTPQGRVQLLHAQAARIEFATIPAAWRNAPIVHLAPIMQDVPLAEPITEIFPNALVGTTPQGWLRHVHPTTHLVTTTPTALVELPLEGVRVVVVSEEDVQGDEQIVQELSSRIPIVVLTRAERGATVLFEGDTIDVPAVPATVVDATGAGDVFTAAFLGALSQGSELHVATRRACAAAAWSIEAYGVSGLPTEKMVQQRLQQYSR